MCFCCKYCGIPGKEPSRDELLNEKSADLLWILKHNDLNTVGLVEKEAIVQEIIDQYNRHPRTRQYCGQNANQETRRSNARTANFANNRRSHSPTTIATSSVYEQPYIPPPSYDTHMRNNAEASVITEIPQQPKTDRVDLREIKNREEIESLSVKQMKIILAVNLVNYSGCFERADLIDRVNKLWDAHQEEVRMSENAADISEAEDDGHAEDEPNSDKKDRDSDLCKICFAHPANTAFLNCGHMVACVACASGLSECPICRSFIVRSVRIFRS
ncbi:hypothetical protein Ciccas_003667 [Cichlidogyrus casuarinus]|uniref:RING-type domain-containing protein n=1 Tax=Cichlidogyrus casuarinus TaxID=1844966 RepID=A0ABD2QDQ5_9PLAT